MTGDDLVSKIQAAAVTNSLRCECGGPQLVTANDHCGQIVNLSYRLGRCLVSGDTGAIYQAYDFISHRPCSLKLVHAYLSNAVQLQQRLAHEAAIVSGLSHRNVIQASEFKGDEQGNLFIVMEPLYGCDLQHVLVDASALPLKWALSILCAVGAALQYLHDGGIVHGDIQPGCIFLHNEAHGSGGEAEEVIKVMNFGLARQLPPRGRQRPDPKMGPAFGTLAYMAPEALTLGGEQVDTRSDQWSLAALAYRLLSGRLPFPNSNPHSASATIHKTEPEPLEKLMPDLPRQVFIAMRRALSKNKERRYARVSEFISELCSSISDDYKPAIKVNVDDLGQRGQRTDVPQKAMSVPVLTEERTREYPMNSLPALLLESARREETPPPQPLTASPRPSPHQAKGERQYWAVACIFLAITSIGAGLSIRRTDSLQTLRALPESEASAVHSPLAARMMAQPDAVLDRLPHQFSSTADAPLSQPLPRSSSRPVAHHSNRKSRLAAGEKEGICPDRPEKDQDALDPERKLGDAQTEYVNGNYKMAITLASAVQHVAPRRAWRIIGSAACYIKDTSLASDAISHLATDASAQKFVRHVCKRNSTPIPDLQ